MAAAALCLIGAAVLTLAAGRYWVSAPGPADRTIAAFTTYTKGESAALTRALGLAALAGVVGIAAARGRGRVAVGAVLAVVGVAAAAVSVRAGVHPVAQAEPGFALLPVHAALRSTGWPWVAACGGVLVALAGLLVAVRGPRWKSLSQRYAGAATVIAPDTTEAGLWDALSRGDDPT